MADKDEPISEWRSARTWLAFGVTLISIIGVTALAWAVITQPVEPGARAQNVLSTVLPLLGTWVGTVLAFYFSRENFEAATRSVTSMAKQLTTVEKLKSLAAKEKMIPISGIVKKTLPKDKDTPLLDVLKEMDAQQKGRRLPVFSDDLKPTLVIHRSTIDKYLVDKVQSATPPNIKALTLQNLIDDTPGLKASVATVKEDATLADAKAAMELLDDCQDVFVTKTGKKDAEAMGWITNVIIQDNAEV